MREAVTLDPDTDLAGFTTEVADDLYRRLAKPTQEQGGPIQTMTLWLAFFGEPNSTTFLADAARVIVHHHRPCIQVIVGPQSYYRNATPMR